MSALLESVRCQWNLQGQSMLGQVPLVLVVNGSIDGTASEVLLWGRHHPEVPLVTIEIDFPDAEAHVGTARRLGMDVAGAMLERHGAGHRMLFSTDADSRLAPTALAAADDQMSRGADAVGAHTVAGEHDHSRIGVVINAYRAMHARVRHQYYAGPLDRMPSHGDFGGAGFGVRLEAYTAVGGLPRLRYDEDQGMRRRLLDAGLTLVYPRSVRVYTSTRMDGRVDWGMARQLAAWEMDYAMRRWPQAPGHAGVAWKYALKARLRRGEEPGDLDPTGVLAAVWARTDPDAYFEARWCSLWSDARVVALREGRFPQRPLPQAYEELARAVTRAG